MSTPHDIRLAIEPVLDPLGLVVEDVTVSQAGRRSVVRVLVDTDISGLDAADTASPVEGLSLDAVADVGRLVDVHADTIAIEVAPTKKTPGRTLQLALDGIQRGTVQVEFTRPPTTANPDLEPDESSSEPDEEN